MADLYLILNDQLSFEMLKDFDKEKDHILMFEILEEATYVKHHKKKLVFIFSAMRHFVDELKINGYPVEYICLDDPRNTQHFDSEIKHFVEGKEFNNIIISQPSDFRLYQKINELKKEINVSIVIREDFKFLCSSENFAKWAGDKTKLRMEFFYREMRKKYSVLMTSAREPVGGKWNYDSENRKFPKENLEIPQTYQTKTDAITNKVIEMVEKLFPEHFGDIYPFNFAVTRSQALKALSQFIEERLANFGDFQDAMVENEPWMYHSHLSFYLNCGLLLPLECIDAAEEAYNQGKAPLNSVEGFIRQILGWREYIRGIYWLKMPEYSKENFFEAKRNLPWFFWGGNTNMNCLKQCVKETKENAYAHHIQRLMVLGNFALLAAVDPDQVNEWFLVVYADAYEWVELPNVSGMILFADGGYLASKPYAAGGAYINKMSNYCKNCHYKFSQKNGDKACPFNYLYWDFLARNREKLKDNHRIIPMYRIYDKMSEEKRKLIEEDSSIFFNKLKNDIVV